ncbi:hypothetical protein B5K08_31165 [Rhizobium leguminosarum bv. trifolii]|uniref:Uncharacterized protein n=1 Tax=Rhizobium leguminosarum bv. trifolii TaxID=386 RepID=A0A3E1AY99_RHILT|nr:hypothetical protein B5K10_31160 [Rhizobium leguminosarum bv. trifolii]RFB82670.1 hypothetical protein B5K08_31165 [Rhizobium leguminosarum bv. trifolii]
MEIACAKRWNGSACTIASRFPTTSCWWISTGSRRFQRRDPGAPGEPAGAITPVLGGVGLMTITRLMHNICVASRGRLANFSSSDQ